MQNWLFKDGFKKTAWVSAGVLGTTYLISQTEGGPAIFGGAYAAGTLYLMNEWYQSESEVTELLVPFGLLTLGVVNLTLLRKSDTYSKQDVFVFNVAGLSALAAYAYWEYQIKVTPQSAIAYVRPVITDRYSGLLFSVHY